MTHWLITGANGNLGKRLITQLLEEAQSEVKVTALVRSTRAQQVLEGLPLSPAKREALKVEVVDYTDVEAVAQAAAGCGSVVHLVGILKATRNASYEQAHEHSCEALVAALKNTPVKHITYMSIVGSKPDAANACLRSKGRAEEILRTSSIPTCVLRVPMVLGEGDYASFALAKRARSRVSFGFRNASLEQPIYAGDVVSAICSAQANSVDAEIDLGGPEVLSRKQLSERAAAVLGNSHTSLSLPLWLGLGLASIFETVMSNPPVTRAMLEVLDHDDNVDSTSALSKLGLSSLTSLDETLKRVL